MNNIWTSFKNELGFVTASIQYSELSFRVLNTEHKEEINGRFLAEFAKQYNLSISLVPDDMGLRLVGSYIIQIQSCVERFLINYHRLIGSPIYREKYDSKNDGNYLKWTMEHSLADHTKEYEEQYRICDYYRLLRNEIIHYDEKNSPALKAAYSLVQNVSQDKLHAPNSITSICFDDQVLFARSAKQLVEAIYSKSNYNWEVILAEHKDELTSIVGSCKHDQIKSKKKIENYLRRLYPIPSGGIEVALKLFN